MPEQTVRETAQPAISARAHHDAPPHAAILRSPSQSVRNLTTWFKLGIIGDAGPEITNGLGAFLLCGTSKARFRIFSYHPLLRGKRGGVCGTPAHPTDSARAHAR